MKRFLLVHTLVLSFVIGSAQSYAPGYYYTTEGAKVEGEILHAYRARFGKGSHNYILFKGNGRNKEKLTPAEASSFVRGKDSFTVLKNFAISPMVSLEQDFVRVVKTGKVNLYMHYTTRPSMPLEDTYLLEKGGIVRYLDKWNVNELAQLFFSDDKALVQQISNTKWRDLKIKEIVEQYNQMQ